MCAGIGALNVYSTMAVPGYSIIDTLGEGSYGFVKLVVDSRTGEKSAVKSLSLKQLGQEGVQNVRKEIYIHKLLHHVNVICFKSLVVTPTYYHILLEFASGGELFDRIEPDYGVHPNLAHFYFRQIVVGVHYLHSGKLISNCLFLITHL